MKITVGQLRRIIRETLDEMAGGGMDYSSMSDGDLFDLYAKHGDVNALREMERRSPDTGRSSQPYRGSSNRGRRMDVPPKYNRDTPGYQFMGKNGNIIEV